MTGIVKKMNKIISKILSTSLLLSLLLLVSFSAQAANPTSCKMVKSGIKIGNVPCPDVGMEVSYDDEDKGVCCLANSVYRVADWASSALILATILLVIGGGFNFMTSAGDETKVKTARNMITWAIIGLLVAALAKAVPSIALNIIK